MQNGRPYTYTLALSYPIMPRAEFHIIPSDEINRAKFKPLGESISDAIAALDSSHGFTENKARHLRALDENSQAQVIEKISHALKEMGFRRFAPLALGTSAIVLDATADQVVRISISSDEKDARAHDPYVIQPYAKRDLGTIDVRTGSGVHMHAKSIKIEVLPKLDFKPLSFWTQDKTGERIVLDEKHPDYIARMAIHNQLFGALAKRAGWICVDGYGDNAAVMKNNMPIIVDTGNATNDKTLVDILGKENIALFEQGNLRLTREDESGQEIWIQKDIYPLIESGHCAGVIPDDELKTLQSDPHRPIRYYQGDGKEYELTLSDSLRTKFLKSVEAGDYPAHILADFRKDKKPYTLNPVAGSHASQLYDKSPDSSSLAR